MSNNPSSPLLGGSEREDDQSTAAQNGYQSANTSSKKQASKQKYSDESTPLLSRDPDQEEEPTGDEDPAATDFVSIPSGYSNSSKKRKTRWRLPTIISICVLILILVAIIIFGFAIPSIMEEYAEQAVVFNPTDLSIESITTDGVKARVEGDFVLDGSRVQKKPVRDLGRAGTWIAAAIEASPSNAHVYLPERDHAVLGEADIPPIVVSIRDGEVTHLNFTTNVTPGDFDGLRQVAKDWLDGRLSELRVTGKADVALKSGIFSLGTHPISKDLLFRGM